MKKKLIIFDIDGLLLDTEQVWLNVWQEVGKKYHVEGMDLELFKLCVGRSEKEDRAIFKEKLDYPDTDFLYDECNKIGYEIIDKEVEVKKGGFELLDYLKSKNYRICVATSTRRDLTIKRLTDRGLINYFEFILCGDEVKNAKPDPEIYLKVLDKAGVKASDAIIFEDSIHGITAAKASGANVIMVPDIIMPTKEDLKGLTCVIESLDKAIPLID